MVVAHPLKSRLLGLILTTALVACSPNSIADDGVWPKVRSPIAQDAEIEAKIDSLLAQMSVEQKVGQMIQAEIKSISPDDAAEYHIGSILNGGGSWPTDKADGPLGAWLSMANLFYGASMDTGDDRLAIPILWGTDAVHGHNNVVGATIFPHNIGLGAANNPDLMRDIGTVTAREVAVTGIDWTFAPTVAVARDARWGRTYESYSEKPNIVANLSKEFVVGLQGHPALDNFLSEQKIIATAKHFIGDGGTANGKDQGETTLTEQELFDIHGQGYVTTLGVGAQTVMASFNSWNGEKLHGSKYMLTDVLKGQMGFDGLVVGDWNGHAQIEGCTNASCPQAINAGVDLIMVPEDWKAFSQNTISQVKAGDIPMSRVDDAVRRILRVKYRAGMFDSGKPSEHALAGRAKLLGHADHRAIARQAVSESLVLLKNDGVLPINPNSRILVAGSGADNPALQSGGWTVTWQGRHIETRALNPRKYYKGHTTIADGIRDAAASAGGETLAKPDPDTRPDVAIIVFGETPYAEFEGDLANLDFDLLDNEDFKLMQSLKSDGVPVVAVFLTGRPRGVDAAIDLADAFVTAWLPGSEGAGVADVLIAAPDGSPRQNFKGKLPFSWPANGVSSTDNEDVKYKVGYGLTY
ncbi:glycoside hydrolase family 3 protein [Litorimonas sp. RW-G-Af-16]|uniref:glycoside hydrolase family 3 protein n=1 Tax=Litorimonas sp. RW-G-Af-16 TaxID=3241168 RepID=UPI00390C8618